MTGVLYPRDCNASCNSSPFIPGICKSVIRHVVSAITLDWRKYSAELKVMALYPKDSTSSRMPSRASASSSTIEINGDSDISTLRRLGIVRSKLKTSHIQRFDLPQVVAGCCSFTRHAVRVHVCFGSKADMTL